MEEESVGRLSELVKIGGYLIAGGALVGFSVGIYLLFDRSLFSLFIQVWEAEVLSYFLSVFMPSFAVLMVIGYLFATALGPKRVSLSNVLSLCVLSIVSMALSALSVFYFLSFLGSLITLVALVKAYAKPAFSSMSTNLAFFLVEFGAMFLAAFSILFLSMWLVSNFFVTYAMGYFGTYSPVALLMVGVFSLMLFIGLPLWGSRGTNLGLRGTYGIVMTLISYLFVVQSQYVLFNASAYIGETILISGFALVLVGSLMYVRLFFSIPEEPVVPVTATLYQGKYCPFCGTPRKTGTVTVCSNCGRSLMWTPNAPFCSACGRLVPSDAQTCPHCHDDITNKRLTFNLTATKEQVIAQKLMAKPENEKSRIAETFGTFFKPFKIFRAAVLWVIGFFSAIIDRTELNLKQAVIILILTYAFGFIAFIGYVRVELGQLFGHPMVIVNYGYPLEWLQVKTFTRPIQVRNVVILPLPLSLDIILYFSAAFLLIYGMARLRR